MGASSKGEGLGLLNREWQFESARAYQLVAIPWRTGSARDQRQSDAGGKFTVHSFK